MRKYGLLMAVLILLLTSCGVSDEERARLVKGLEKKGIVEKSIEEIDFMKMNDHGIIPHSEDYYIYENDNGDLSAIVFNTNTSKDYDYTIIVYSDVEKNDVDFVEDSKELETGHYYYTRSENAFSSDMSYSIQKPVKYQVVKRTVLRLFTIYKFEKVK